MSAIDLILLGMLIEAPRSAYDLQKDVEAHHLSRWTKISTPTVYRKAVQLADKGYLKSETIKGDKFADKTLYSITEKGQAYFETLMHQHANQHIQILLDFNVVVANLNKLDQDKALGLLGQLKASIHQSAQANEGYAKENAGIPLVGEAIFEQHRMVYDALKRWVQQFEGQFQKE